MVLPFVLSFLRWAGRHFMAIVRLSSQSYESIHGRRGSVRGGSDGHPRSSAPSNVRVIPQVPSAVRIRAVVGAQSEVLMVPLREIPCGQVAIEKNRIAACFTCVEPITRDLCHDAEQ